MITSDPEALLALLRDPNRETQEIAQAAGVPREDAARASRLVLSMGKAKPEEVLSLPVPLALALLRAAAAAQRADVLATAAGHANKEVAKEGKRALYLLRARGLPVPEPARPVKAASTPPAPEAPPACYASALDGRGERAVWVARVVPGKGIEVGQAVLSDQRGILELHVGVLGRKEYRNFGKDLLERGRSMGIAEVERERAIGWVASARALQVSSGQRLPEGAEAWLTRLGPSAPVPHPENRFPPLPPEEERQALEASARLHELPLVRGWLAEEEILRSLALKLDEVAVSNLYIDERQRAEAAASAVAQALTTYFDDARRALWAERLFATAEHLERLGDEVHPRLAAAAARALRAGQDVSRIPFARMLFEKAFPARPDPAAQVGGQGSSLILPPTGRSAP
ncbi:MAG TPA: hypothetical protein VLV17_01795 [Anaeromyxobacteraceae bacterium]|nr:hypothetical protein [Anaeromyxobacteraceae bacterium]